MFRQERIESRGVRFNEAAVQIASCDIFLRKIIANVSITVGRYMLKIKSDYRVNGGMYFSDAYVHPIGYRTSTIIILHTCLLLVFLTILYVKIKLYILKIKFFDLYYDYFSINIKFFVKSRMS